ncbi:hypothetical protein FBU59_005634 [Linderina macrospora]|uniref:Uncharacterized protein n=1 Tax=Linderina macrospora TaxID=4868 RepID=A0ACC1J233_9FUNG|nr:hypothetical protein FBU59_005634 [Linderina macrospora]
MKRLSRNLTGSYAETWQDVLERHFKRPPWKSCTVMLTIIIVYWDIFKAALPYDLLDKIKSILPWVMHVEGVNSCPQVSGPLPPGATVAAFHYTAATTASGDARVVEAMQTQERLSQTVNLINTMKQLLVQCETVESDEQTAHREKLVKEWVMWVRSNSNS